MLTSFVADSV